MKKNVFLRMLFLPFLVLSMSCENIDDSTIGEEEELEQISAKSSNVKPGPLSACYFYDEAPRRNHCDTDADCDGARNCWHKNVGTRLCVGNAGKCAILYTEAFYKGKALYFDGPEDLRDLGSAFDDQVSSLRVRRGTFVTLWEHADYRGRKVADVHYDIDDLRNVNVRPPVIRKGFLNDKTSSVKVW